MQADEIRSVLERANGLLEAGYPAQTLVCLEGIDGAELDPDDGIECALMRAWALSELDRNHEALECLEPLREQYPDFARLRCTLGVVYSNAGDLEQASRELKCALELENGDDVALTNLGLVCEKRRDFAEALRIYDQAAELGADIDWLLQRKAAVQAELGDLRGAKTSLRRYLSLAPDDDEQWIQLGILHSDDQEYAQAYDCYRSAENIAPDAAGLRLNWGVTAVRAGQLEIAKGQLAYLERGADCGARALLLGAFIAEEEGDVSSAGALYAEALGAPDAEAPAALSYALEMGMDFFSRHDDVASCERLMRRAYAADACTVELCEAYREATGDVVDRATWFSVLIDIAPRGVGRSTLSNFQCVASDRDHAAAILNDFLERVGESDYAIREFFAEEPISDTYTGLYEIDCGDCDGARD